MRTVRNLFVAACVVATLAVAVLPAHAVPPGGTIAASVNGRVQVFAGTCADGRSRSEFTQVEIVGVFANGTSNFRGTVGVSNVPVCLTPLVGGNQLLANGTLEPGAVVTYAGVSGANSVNGSLSSLNFTNLGVVSIATVGTTFNVNGTGNVSVTARAVVLALPIQTVACEAGVTAVCQNPAARDVVAAVIVA